jgi:hypothetical protein
MESNQSIFSGRELVYHQPGGCQCLTTPPHVILWPLPHRQRLGLQRGAQNVTGQPAVTDGGAEGRRCVPADGCSPSGYVHAKPGALHAKLEAWHSPFDAPHATDSSWSGPPTHPTTRSRGVAGATNCQARSSRSWGFSCARDLGRGDDQTSVSFEGTCRSHWGSRRNGTPDGVPPHGR